MEDFVSKITNEIIQAELKLGNAENNVSETIVQLEALDLLLRQQTIQTSKTDLDVEDAIEILRESEFIKDARNRIVQYEANQRGDVKHYREKVNRLKGDRYDVARVWINEEIDLCERKLANRATLGGESLIASTRRQALEDVYEFLEGEWPDEEEDSSG